jgi:ribosomal protein L17
MAAFRFLSVSILSFLLLSPLIKTVNREVEKPVIIVAQDNSQSLIIGKDSSFYRTEYKKKLQKLIDELGDKYEVRSYSFADKVKELGNTDSLKFNEKQTDISSLFDEIETRYSNRNVGAIILASDGLYNKGSNPVYTSSKIKIPVYTIALGDTTAKKDLILSKAEHNRIAYLGNKFPVEIEIDAKQFKGKTTTLTMSKGDINLFTQTVNISTDAYRTTIPVILEAKETGLQHYRIKLSPLPDEVSLANNIDPE